MVVLVQAQQEVRDAPHRRGILPALGRQRPGDHGEERAVDEGVAVHEEDVRLAGGHGGGGRGWARRHGGGTKTPPQKRGGGDGRGGTGERRGGEKGGNPGGAWQ